MSFVNVILSFLFGSCVCAGISTVMMLYVCLFIFNCGHKSKDILPPNKISKKYHIIIFASIIISVMYIYGVFYITYFQQTGEYFCFLRTLRMFFVNILLYYYMEYTLHM